MCIIIQNSSRGTKTMQAIQKTKSPVNALVDSVYDRNMANFWLQKINTLWSVNQALGKIVKKEQVANDMVTLTIRCNRIFKKAQAGQHHPVLIEINGRTYERTYSLCNLDQDHVQLTVKHVDQGVVSTWLCETAQVGDVLKFGQPYGEMTLDKVQEPLVLLAAGSGITPMYSMLQALAQAKKLQNQPIHLLYWVKKKGDAAFLDIFENWAKSYANVEFQVFYTQENDADERLNSAHLDTIRHIDQATVFACGPSGFVATAEGLFDQAKHFQSEAFSLSPTVNDDVGFVNITLTKSNKVLAVAKGESILTALEQQNVKPTYGCRMGICHKCVCQKVQGSTKNLLDGAVNPEPNNQIKICVNSAQSDLVIDL